MPASSSGHLHRMFWPSSSQHPGVSMPCLRIHARVAVYRVYFPCPTKLLMPPPFSVLGHPWPVTKFWVCNKRPGFEVRSSRIRKGCFFLICKKFASCRKLFTLQPAGLTRIQPISAGVASSNRARLNTPNCQVDKSVTQVSIM